MIRYAFVVRDTKLHYFKMTCKTAGLYKKKNPPGTTSKWV